jgi:signal transduction histidine kinase
VDCQVLTDPLRVQQVLANLLSNAVKFSRAGQTVRLSCQVSQGQAVIRVSDQGCGIPEAFHSQVFERFAQADTGNQRRVKGTGLGLAISKELVERMQGSIGFDSTPGLGTTFWFTLPLATEG